MVPAKNWEINYKLPFTIQRNLDENWIHITDSNILRALELKFCKSYLLSFCFQIFKLQTHETVVPLTVKKYNTLHKKNPCSNSWKLE